MGIEDGSLAESEKIKPKVSILADGRLATLKEGNEDYFAQQEQVRRSKIGERKHFGPKDRGEVYYGVRDGEALIDDEQKTDIIAAELEERALDDPSDESVKQMLDFIRSLHSSEAKSENLSIYGLGRKKLEDLREQINSRPMALEDRQKLEAQAESMQLALDYYGDRLQKINGEQLDAAAQVPNIEGQTDYMAQIRMRNATREAASRILDEHNARVDRNGERKAS